MGFSELRLLMLNTALEAFGVAATVTRPSPDNTPINTSGVWTIPAAAAPAMGGDLRRREPIHVMAIPRADVPTFPRGTTVSAPERQGGDAKTWKFDGFESEADPDHWRVRLVL